MPPSAVQSQKLLHRLPPRRRSQRRSPRARFWVGLLIFQCFFGFSVFILTKAHYERPSLLAASMVAERRSSAGAVGTPPRPSAMTSSLPPPTSSARLSGSPSPGLASQPTTSLRAQASSAFTQADYVKAAQLYRELAVRMPSDIEVRNNFAISAHYAGDSIKLSTHFNVQYRTTRAPKVLVNFGFHQRAAGNARLRKLPFNARLKSIR